MNRTFKVVFSKARGALMVTNEVTSSVQNKGTAKVVAAAVAMALSGAVVAADQTETWTDKVINEEITIAESGNNDVVVNSASLQSGGKIIVGTGINVNYDSANSKGDFSIEGGELNIAEGGNVQVRDFTMSDGKIVVTGGEENTDNGSGRTSPAFGAYNSFVMTGGEIELSSNGRIWLGSASKSNPDRYGRMELKGGTVTLTDGGWITGDKRLITEANSDGKYEGDPVFAYNTIGLDGATVVVNGSGNTIDAVRTELTGGSLTVNGDLTVRATVSTNQPQNEREAALEAIEDASAFVVTGGTLTVAEGGTLTFNNEIERFEITGGVVDNKGLIEAQAVSLADSPDTVQTDLTVTIGDGGRLNTSIYQDNFQVQKVVVNEGGVFNIAALNSKTDDKLEAHDRLLIGFGNEWTLAGGKLLVDNEAFKGRLKIGTANVADETGKRKGTGVLNVTAGDYHFSMVEFGSAEGNALNISGGTVAVDKLDMTNGVVNVSAEGTLQTSSDQVFTAEGYLFAAAEGEAKDVANVTWTNSNIVFDNGTLALTDEGYYTSTTLKAMTEALSTGQLAVLHGQLVAGENPQIVDNALQATIDAKVDGKVDDGVVTIKPTNAGVQSLTVTSEGAESLALGSGEGTALTLTGSAAGGQLVKNEAGKALAVSVAEGSVLGLGSSAVQSETKGALDSLEVSGTASVVNMAAEVKDLTLNGTGTVTVGNDANRGALDVESLTMSAGSSIFLDPAVFGTVADASHFGAQTIKGEIAGEIIAGQNAIVSLGATSDEGAAAVNTMLERNGLAWGKDITAAVYIGSAVTLADTGYVVADGSLTSEKYAPSGVTGYDAGTLTVANQGLLAARQDAVSGDDVLVNGTVAFKEGSTLAIVNATEGEFNLAKDVSGEANVITDNPFYEAQLSNGKVVTSQDTANGVSSIASAGLQAMTRRADFVLSQTVADRASIDQELQPGVNLWVDVSGENYQMDGMDYGAEFEADTFYGTFGGDVKLGDAYTLGAAFQYGDGSLRSSVNGVKNDVTNYGLALYGTAKFGAAKVVGELSYIWGENDITASQSALNQSVDTSIYSAGVTGMYELRAGGFSFIPSIGLRVSQLETDAMRVGDVSIEDQDQTLFQIPVALRINGADMNAGGWKLAPSFKIAYVPTFGDTEINVRNIEADVIDTSPVQMDLGLRAGTENLLLNAAFSLGAGKEGSSSIGGKIGLKYAF